MAASISYRKNTLYYENKLSSLDELTKILTKEAEGGGTKAMHTAEDMLEARNADSGMPYGPQMLLLAARLGLDGRRPPSSGGLLAERTRFELVVRLRRTSV